MSAIAESHVEEAALMWLSELGYAAVNGLEIGPDGSTPERENYGEVLLLDRLRAAIERLNPSLAPRRPRGGARQDRADARRRRWSRKTAACIAISSRACRSRCAGQTEPISGEQARLDRLRRPRRQRLARGQPVHGHREPREPAARRRDLRQRPAARRDRTEEPRRRERDHRRGVPSAPDLQVADRVAVSHQRRADDLRRPRRADRLADRRPRAVHALAHNQRRRSRAEGNARTGNRAQGRVRTPPVPRLPQGLHRLRRHGARRRQNPRGLSPVPCRAARGRVHARGDRARRRPQGRGDLAHPGLGQEPADGLLRGRDHQAPGDAEPDPRAC